ncbi:MAG: DUF1343 domain-containing protein [Bacteroidota bacterium]
MANLTKIVVLLLLFKINCGRNLAEPAPAGATEAKVEQQVVVGAAQTERLLSAIDDKVIGMVVNHTSMVGQRHLVDQLLQKGTTIKAIFAPEHGFRGTADAGAKIEDGKDSQTGLPVISLYGKKKKPLAKDLQGIELMIFDIQDVGARFYTYISTMHYVMEACAENGIPLLILDRPNPNGHYVDGPVLEADFQSFVGMHPVPVVHGMTVGEYAQMINGEAWLASGLQCELSVIPCMNYDHQTAYELPIKPSPNLPNNRAIYLYPSLCFFEGTVLSVGRGTEQQFQVIGHPDLPPTDFSFQPIPRPGARYPKHENQRCNGYDLSTLPLNMLREKSQLDLSYLLELYDNFEDKPTFFLPNLFFDKLAGTATLRQQIIDRTPEAAIRASWEPALSNYKKMREKYLIYD